jgi:hypothetical protein
MPDVKISSLTYSTRSSALDKPAQVAQVSPKGGRGHKGGIRAAARIPGGILNWLNLSQFIDRD